MKNKLTIAASLALVVSLSACGSTKVASGVVPSAPAGSTGLSDPFPIHKIGPSDVLSVVVYREEDLSLESVTVDSSGSFQMPLIGKVTAAGKTADQLSSEITASLGSRYLVRPDVAVNVTTTGSRRFTIEGAVNTPGVYLLDNNTTLLGALAISKGPVRIASLKEIAIFRDVDGARQVAVFDGKAIREGRAADPKLEPNDTIVVGYSGLTKAWQDFLQAAPIMSIFTRF